MEAILVTLLLLEIVVFAVVAKTLFDVVTAVVAVGKVLADNVAFMGGVVALGGGFVIVATVAPAELLESIVRGKFV